MDVYETVTVDVSLSGRMMLKRSCKHVRKAVFRHLVSMLRNFTDDVNLNEDSSLSAQ